MYISELLFFNILKTMNYKIKNACTRASILKSYYHYKSKIYAQWYTSLQHYKTSIAVLHVVH